MPGTVRISVGRLGSNSTFSRRRRMWTLTARSVALDVGGVAPHGVEDLATAEGLAGMAGQVDEQPELGGRQTELLVAAP